MFVLLIKGSLLVLFLTFVLCCCSVIIVSTYETIFGKDENSSDKEWIHEKCGTNTPPKEAPKKLPFKVKNLGDLNSETNKEKQRQKELKKKLAPLKVSEGFWCIYKGDVYILSEENGFPRLKLMDFQDLDEKYRWLEQWNH